MNLDGVTLPFTYFMIHVLSSVSDCRKIFNNGPVTILDLRPLVLQLLTHILWGNTDRQYVQPGCVLTYCNHES